MKPIKLIDLAINVLLIAWFLFQRCWNDFDKLITAYLTIGGWQIISMLFHEYKKWFTKRSNPRYIFHWLAFIIVITIPIGLFRMPPYSIAPMVFFYPVLCTIEILSIRRRPLSLLK